MAFDFKEVLVADIDVALILVEAFKMVINAVANAVKPLSSLIGYLGSALSTCALDIQRQLRKNLTIRSPKEFALCDVFYTHGLMTMVL